MSMKNWMLVALVVAGIAGPGQAVAQDVAAGESLYQASCRTCHGPRAQGMGSFPRLAGSEAEHVVLRLEEYRAGERVGPNTALMAPHAVNLSDEEIADLAAYIATSFN